MFRESDVMSKKLLSIILTSIILVFSSVGVDATEVPKTTNDIPVTEKNGYQGINFESKRLTSQEYDEKLLQNEEKISLLRIQNTGIVLAVITIIINYPQRRKEPGMS